MKTEDLVYNMAGFILMTVGFILMRLIPWPEDESQMDAADGDHDGDDAFIVRWDTETGAAVWGDEVSR